MDQLDILKSPQGYAGQNRNLSSRWKAEAQRLCWTYNQLPPDQPERRREILQKLLGDCSDLTNTRSSVPLRLRIQHPHLRPYRHQLQLRHPGHLARPHRGRGPSSRRASAWPARATRWMRPSAQRASARRRPSRWRKTSGSAPTRWSAAASPSAGARSSAQAAWSPHDIPAGVVAAGVPCRPIRPVTDRDRIPPERLAF